jgi:lysophospholipase L1-like esterase
MTFRTLLRWVVAPLAIVLSSCGGGSPNQPTPVPPPTLAISCPSNVSKATEAGNTALVDFSQPTTSGGTAPVTVVCAPTSGSTFAVGTNAVTCTATDAAAHTATCTFNVTVTNPHVLTYTRYLAFGDSTTEGYLREPPTFNAFYAATLIIPTETYPFKLQQMLTGAYPSQTFEVINKGKGGETLDEGRARLVGVIQETHPEVLLLFEGYNEIRDFSTSQLRSDLRAMVRSAQVRGVQVLLGTLFHVTKARNGKSPGENDAIDALNAQIRSLAAELNLGPVVDLEAAFGDDESLYGSDGLHPNPAGYQRIAETFFEAITSRYEVAAPTPTGATMLTRASH